MKIGMFHKDKYRGELAKLRRILNIREPIDRQIYRFARKKELSFVFVELKEDVR